MAKLQKNQEMQEVDHAYANLEHEEWKTDIQTWKNEINFFKEIVARAQKWLDFHETQLGNHEEKLSQHESAVKEHGEGATTGANVRYIKDVADRRHELYGRTHSDQTILHEDLKRRHYIMVGQLGMLAQAMEPDKF